MGYNPYSAVILLAAVVLTFVFLCALAINWLF